MTTGSPSVILNATDSVPVPVALVADMVTEVEPTTVGVPEIIPVAVSKDKPAGSAVELKLVGVLVAVMV